jgi:hypothetical protein
MQVEIKFHFFKYISLRKQMYSGFHFLGYNNCWQWGLLKLINIFGSLEAINYIAAYSHYWMKSLISVSQNKVVIFLPIQVNGPTEIYPRTPG